MRRNLLAVDDIGRDAILVCANSSNSAQRARVDLLPTVTDDTYDDLLPSVPSPNLATIALTEISDVLHDAVHGAREERVILIIHSHDDEELRPAGRVIVHLSQREPVVLKVIRVARSGRITQMCELALFFECAEVK